MNLKEIEAKVRSVQGWLMPSEARLLYRLARNCAGSGAIVEIGSWKGKSTIWLGHGSLAGKRAKVHAVDPHTGSPEHHAGGRQVSTYDEFARNIHNAGLGDLVEPHVDFSESVARRFNDPVELVFIDGLHEYEGVKTDFEAWFPKLVEGGIMAFHDTAVWPWPGPRKLVIEEVFKSRCFKRVRFVGTIVYAQKTTVRAATEGLENRLMLAVFLVWAFFFRLIWNLNNKGWQPVRSMLERNAWVRKAFGKPALGSTKDSPC
jgi:MMP 1-O-methyltransferase